MSKIQNSPEAPIQYKNGWVEFYKRSFQNSPDAPIQYKKGYCEFYKLKFKVTPDVLIPRPETELLVDEIRERVKNAELITHNPKLIILDIGTGAGNISISLASHLKGVKVNIIATDISEKALKVARLNAKFHRVVDRIEFIQSDLLSGLSDTLIHRYSDFIWIIVTNLPYIPFDRIPYLDSSVKDFEPHLALDGGEDGFSLYRKLFAQIKEKGLKPNVLIGEIDYTHGELAAREAQKFFPKAQVETKTDLAHRQRILTIAF